MKGEFTNIREKLRTKYPRIAGDILDDIIQEVSDAEVSEMDVSNLKPLLGSRLSIASYRHFSNNEISLKFVRGDSVVYIEVVDGVVCSTGEGQNLDTLESGEKDE